MPGGVALLVDLYELTMAQSYFYYKKRSLATFDLFVRKLPKNRSYLVACGLVNALDYIKNLKFGREELFYLKRQKLFSADFLKFLKDFEFSGDVWAMREGEIFFANEPLLRVTAPIIEAQLLESFLLNTINLETMIASKAARVVSAGQGRGVYDFSLRRTQGQDAALKVARSAYLAGFNGTSNVLAAKLYGLPVVGTMAHSFVMSFKNERASFQAYAQTFPPKTVLLVDTYDTKKGIQNAIQVGLELKEKGERLLGIRLDSGNIVQLSKMARRMLDGAGLNYTKIFASGNLDEFRIKKLLDKGSPVDNFGVGTRMGSSEDAPSLDVIYKISEVSEDGTRFLPTMKLSKDKVNYPGRKQVFRVTDKRGYFLRDILALDRENIKGRPLLIKVVDKGRVIYKKSSLEEAREYLRLNLPKFPPALKEIYTKYRYPVMVSPKLQRLTQQLKQRLSLKQ